MDYISQQLVYLTVLSQILFTTVSSSHVSVSYKEWDFSLFTPILVLYVIDEIYHSLFYFIISNTDFLRLKKVLCYLYKQTDT